MPEKNAACADKIQIGALFNQFMALDSAYNPGVFGSDTFDTHTFDSSSSLSSASSSPGPSSRRLGKSKKSRKSERVDEPALSKRTKVDDSSSDADDVSADKKEKRRKQNRMAAQTSREKKKRYLVGLEEQVQELTAKNQELQARINLLEAYNRQGHNFAVQAEPLQIAAAHTPFLTIPKIEKREPFCPYTSTTGTTTFESAVFSPPQQPEVMVLLVLILVQIAQAVSNMRKDLARLNLSHYSDALVASPVKMLRSSSSTQSPFSSNKSLSHNFLCKKPLVHFYVNMPLGIT